MVRKTKSKQNGKRTFVELRRKILLSLSNGQKNINELAINADVNWRTTRNHLINLIGRGYIREVINTPQVRIFEITRYGMEVLSKNGI